MKTSFRKHLNRRTLGVAAILGTTLSWGSLAAADSAETSYYAPRELRGRFSSKQVPCDSLCTGGPLTGDLYGDLAWSLSSLENTATPNVARYDGVTTITTKLGTFSGPDYGVWNLATGQFTDYLEITSGTGIFTGAKGTMTIVGAFDPVSGTGTSEWRIVFAPR